MASAQNPKPIKILTSTGYTWVLRYRKDGKHKAHTLGNDQTLPTLKEAKLAAMNLLPTLNTEKKVFLFGQLAERYLAEEMTHRPQTVSSYKTMLKALRSRWDETPLQVMLQDLMAIQTWLCDLKTADGSRPLSKKSKQNVKGLLHRLIECAMRWGYLPLTRNPIDLIEIRVRGPQLPKRLKVPISLNVYHRIIADPETEQHVKTMVIIAVTMGLRISEILGLRWSDIDFERGEMTIQRSSVGRHIDDTKTVTSAATMPMHQFLVSTLCSWQEAQQSVNGWVFGSLATGRPFHRDSLQADHLGPAGSRVGIPNLGWHTFRHTHIAFLRSQGIAESTQMMMMRHSDMRTTNSYGRDGGDLDLKRAAHHSVVESILQAR